MHKWCRAGALFLIALPACTRPIPPGSADRGTPPAVSAPPAVARDAEADAAWKRSLEAQRNVPVRGRVAVTRWSESGRAEQRLMEFVESAGGKYRLTYVEPEAARGRVVLCDGKTVWQYEPSERAVLERPAGESADPLRAEHLPEDHSVSLGAAPGPLAGREVRLLEVRMAGDGRVRERFWVDVATGRTLKVEESRADGRLLRRAEFLEVTFPESVASETFRPDFPADARRVTTDSSAGRDAALRANLLGLPKQVNRYHVRSVIASEKPGARQQALYADGVHSVSLFVTPLPETRRGADYREGPGWVQVALADGTVAWTRGDDGDGKAAALWSKDGRQYVVVGRLPRKSLLNFVNALRTQTQFLTSR